jgi:hypothetical protein
MRLINDIINRMYNNASLNRSAAYNNKKDYLKLNIHANKVDARINKINIGGNRIDFGPILSMSKSADIKRSERCPQEPLSHPQTSLQSLGPSSC